MDELNITNTNYLGYKRLYEFKTKNSSFYDKRVRSISNLIAIIGTSMSIIPFMAIAIKYPANFLTITSASFILTIGLAVTATTINKISNYLENKSFQNDYPNVDMSIKTEDLEKELTKYEELSCLPKDLNLKKEEHLANYQDKVKEMTTTEKLAFLEKEREFWSYVSVQEKYAIEEDKPIKKRIDY